MLTLKTPDFLNEHADLIMRLGLAIAALVAAFSLDSGRSFLLIFWISLLPVVKMSRDRNILATGVTYVLAVFFAPLLSWPNSLAVVVLFGVFNLALTLMAYRHSQVKTALNGFLVGNVILAGSALLLAVNEVAMLPKREGLLYAFVFFALVLAPAFTLPGLRQTRTPA